MNKDLGQQPIILDDCSVLFENDTETRDAVFVKLINWYFKHESFSGECIMQSDNPTIDAPVILSEIADEIIKFDVKWNE